ncbi:MAG: hypothetical protein KAS66_00120 [Candidatus Omnitrophica bacterium]|nr:hypothetical protein [Candidatus Omnitrophota bacterium]
MKTGFVILVIVAMVMVIYKLLWPRWKDPPPGSRWAAIKKGNGPPDSAVNVVGIADDGAPLTADPGDVQDAKKALNGINEPGKARPGPVSDIKEDPLEHKRTPFVSVCHCPERNKPIDQRKWFVTMYKHNKSAFSGYKYTPSEHSQIHCTECGTFWRTKAKYVDKLQPLQMALGDATGGPGGELINGQFDQATDTAPDVDGFLMNSVTAGKETVGYSEIVSYVSGLKNVTQLQIQNRFNLSDGESIYILEELTKGNIIGAADGRGNWRKVLVNEPPADSKTSGSAESTTRDDLGDPKDQAPGSKEAPLGASESS